MLRSVAVAVLASGTFLAATPAHAASPSPLDGVDLEHSYVLQVRPCVTAPDMDRFSSQGVTDGALTNGIFASAGGAHLSLDTADDPAEAVRSSAAATKFDQALVGCTWQMRVQPPVGDEIPWTDPLYDDRADRASTYGLVAPGSPLYKSPVFGDVDTAYPGAARITAVAAQQSFRRLSNDVFTNALIASFDDGGRPEIRLRGCRAASQDTDRDGATACTMSSAPAEAVEWQTVTLPAGPDTGNVQSLMWALDCDLEDRSPCQQAGGADGRAQITLGEQLYVIRDDTAPTAEVTATGPGGSTWWSPESPIRVNVQARDLLGIGGATLNIGATSIALDGIGCGAQQGKTFTTRVPCPGYDPARPHALRNVNKTVDAVVSAKLATDTAVSVSVSDALGNATEIPVDLRLDATNPTIAPLARAADSSTVAFSVSDAQSGVNPSTCWVQVRDGQDASPMLRGRVSNATCTATLSSALADDAEITAWVEDRAGNRGTTTDAPAAPKDLLDGAITRAGGQLTLPTRVRLTGCTATIAPLSGGRRTPVATSIESRSCSATLPTDLDAGTYQVTARLRAGEQQQTVTQQVVLAVDPPRPTAPPAAADTTLATTATPGAEAPETTTGPAAPATGAPSPTTPPSTTTSPEEPDGAAADPTDAAAPSTSTVPDELQLPPDAFITTDRPASKPPTSPAKPSAPPRTAGPCTPRNLRGDRLRALEATTVHGDGVYVRGRIRGRIPDGGISVRVEQVTGCRKVIRLGTVRVRRPGEFHALVGAPEGARPLLRVSARVAQGEGPPLQAYSTLEYRGEPGL